MTNAHKKIIAIVFAGVLSFAGSWLVASCKGMPVPHIHDEYSYLLAGDTFAHGRWTNPTHPMWEHLETFHELMKPTYMSKYPPGQGVFLAIGQVLFGHPIMGVWLSAGLMCAAICWMLYAWLPGRWAAVGGVIAALQFGIFTYWSQSYWGGAAAALGGALIFGAVPRILKYGRTRDAWWLGLGIAVILNTRPLEGILIGLPIGCLVLPLTWQGARSKECLKKIMWPLGGIILATLLLMGYYNQRITGRFDEFPHRLYSKQTTTVPLLIWQPLVKTKMEYSYRVFSTYERSNLGYYFYKRQWRGLWHYLMVDLRLMFNFFFGYPLALPALYGALLLFARWQWAWRYFLALFIFVLDCVAMDCMGARPHYFAPLTGLVVLLIVFGFRVVYIKFRYLRTGMAVLLLLFILQMGLNIVLYRLPPTLSYAEFTDGLPRTLPRAFSREELKSYLSKQPGKYLVLVTYPKAHNMSWEWVFNDADIDGSKIVWARASEDSDDRGLIAYFKDRQLVPIKVSWDVINKNFYRYDQR